MGIVTRAWRRQGTGAFAMLRHLTSMRQEWCGAGEGLLDPGEDVGVLRLSESPCTGRLCVRKSWAAQWKGTTGNLWADGRTARRRGGGT